MQIRQNAVYSPGFTNNDNTFDFIKKKEQAQIQPDFKPSIGKKVKGYIGGSLASSGVSLALGVPFTMGSLAFVKKYPELPVDQVIWAAENMVKESGLNKKGFKTIFVDGANKSSLIKKVYKEILLTEKNSPFAKFGEKIQGKFLHMIFKDNPFMPKDLIKDFPKFSKKMMSGILSYMVEKGINAFYLPNANVAATSKGRASLIFHEIGHAINANSSSFMKAFQTSARKLPKIVALPVVLVALLHTNIKSKDGEEKSKFTKIKDTIKDNAGKITFLSFLPMIAEEALASAHGIRYAGKSLGANKALKVASVFAGALTTYVGAAALSALSVKVAGNVRDKIVYPKEMRTNS